MIYVVEEQGNAVYFKKKENAVKRFHDMVEGVKLRYNAAFGNDWNEHVGYNYYSADHFHSDCDGEYTTVYLNEIEFED